MQVYDLFGIWFPAEVISEKPKYIYHFVSGEYFQFGLRRLFAYGDFVNRIGHNGLR
jgi:hypothetical protein